MSPEQAARARALQTLEAIREAVEAGEVVLVEERPPRGVYPSGAGGAFKRCVTFQLNALDYDGRFRANG